MPEPSYKVASVSVGPAAEGLGTGLPVCGPGFYRAAGREIVEELTEARGIEILVIVIVDLDHRGVAAGAEAFDLDPGEIAIRRHGALRADALFADPLELEGAAQHGKASCRKAARDDGRPAQG